MWAETERDGGEKEKGEKNKGEIGEKENIGTGEGIEPHPLLHY